jgi:hypothetical protein
MFSQSNRPTNRVSAVNLRPRICHLLSLLRIHNPDCKHCAAHLTCGIELRKRLQELNAQTPSLVSDRIVRLELRIPPTGTAPRRKGRSSRQSLRA